MNISILWSRILVGAGLAGMLIGAVDPLEGSLVILPAIGFAALGAFLGKSRRRMLLYWGGALVAVGVAAMFVLSDLGGIGGKTGRSMWWAIVLLPYPVGWIMGLAGAVLALIEWAKHHTAPSSGKGAMAD